MKKNMFKKLICTALTAVCVITSVVPTFAEDVITTTEAATTKSVTSAYKYHLEGFDKKGNDLLYSKKSFYKDLNSLPTIGMGKTTVSVPAVTSKVKSVSAEKNKPVYESYLKFKAPKTGTYVFTFTNLNGTNDNVLRAMLYFDIFTPLKDGKKYRLNHVDCYEVGKYYRLWENDYMEKLRAMREAYETEHPDYAHYLEKDVWDKQNIADKAGELVSQGADAYNSYITARIADIIFKAAVYVACYIIVSIIVFIIGILLNVVSRLPVLKQINRISGGIIGLAMGVIFVWLGFVIITFLGNTSFASEAFRQIDENAFLTFMYDRNIILNILIGIF